MLRLFGAFLLATAIASAQEPMPGSSPAPIPAETVPPDTVFIFRSPRPLLVDDPRLTRAVLGGGLEILFSQSGFGLGGYIEYRSTDVLSYVLDLGFSGARNSSEIEMLYDPITGRYLVPDKVNRLFIIPLMVGVSHRLFPESLGETMRPFVSAGIGPTLIVSTPYEYEFFQSFGYARGYVRAGGYVGVGTFIGAPSRGSLALHVRYYYIPFGGDGLESIRGRPITVFGGLFLALSVGFD
ncbi:MAG: hypothetical protein AA908_01965 [Chlorobi bacterium NICIL-2]|nr:MAG: hypothetical protein AA908_01965 [Chlorobi bacterium NICIL-2]